MTPSVTTQRRKLAVAIRAALLTALVAPVAQAIEFQQGDFSGSIDTTVSYGVSMRVQDIDENLIGKGNLNRLVFTLPNAQQRLEPGAYSVNGDDGNLRYADSGDIFASTLKLTTEVSISYRDNYGAFFRGTGFYDFENAEDDDLGRFARRKVGTDVQLLDAFVFGNFDLGGKDATLRVGKQVVSWGESTFIQQGINVINPVDVSRLRVAGAELKEAFLPVDMLWTSVGLSENLSMELAYLLEFENTEPEPVGTYFSTNDFATLDGRFVMLGFGLTPEPVDYDRSCLARQPVDMADAVACAQAIPRAPDRFADDSGQYGVAFRYFSEQLNSTEFGLYYFKHHSRLPLISGSAITSATDLTTGRYFIEYPEDIEVWGLSFNTTLDASGIALQGEYSYRPNAPLQIDDVEVLFFALSPLNALIPNQYSRFQSQLGNARPGEEFRGWENHEISQFQFTLTKVFGPENPLRADQISAVAEFGFTQVWDLPDPSVLRYQGDGTNTGGGGDVNSGSGRNPITQEGGFGTKFSWGYRLAGRFDYNDAFAGINLAPRIAFNHDVNGTTPGPGGNFLEDRKSLTLGVEANYLNAYAVDLSYTRFFGAEDSNTGAFNLIHDRDFVSLIFRYSF